VKQIAGFVPLNSNPDNHFQYSIFIILGFIAFFAAHLDDVTVLETKKKILIFKWIYDIFFVDPQ
jgi:hypothetical protein